MAVTARGFIAQFPNHADFSRKSRTVLFAYYLRQFEKATEFTAADVRRCFQDALLNVPTDLAALLASLTKG